MNEGYRTSVRDSIAECFKLPIDAATELEEGIYQAALSESEKRDVAEDVQAVGKVYKAVWRKTVFNVQQTPALLDTRPLQEIPRRAHIELNPQRWAATAKKRQLSEAEKHLAATTDMYPCKKCQSRKCSHYQMQTRGADEPMTTFITCLNCGHEWRF